jgi:hypothetical protein
LMLFPSAWSASSTVSKAVVLVRTRPEADTPTESAVAAWMRRRYLRISDQSN